MPFPSLTTTLLALLAPLILYILSHHLTLKPKPAPKPAPKPPNLPRKTVLITGCSSHSTGAALAHAFHSTGYTVFATLRSPSRIPSSLTSLPHMHILTLDVTVQSSVDAAVAAVEALVGDAGLDVLVNSAGVMLGGPGLDVEIEERGKECFEVCVWGVLRVTQGFSGLLVKAGEGGGMGKEGGRGRATVVNLGSVVGEIWFVYQPIYAAAKAALHTLSESLRLELRPLSINVLTVVVGAISSNLQANQPPYQHRPSSFYAPVSSYIKDFVEHVVPHTETPIDDFAAQIVADVEAGRSGKVWRGQGVWLIWVLRSFVWGGIVDWMFSALKGMGELRRVREEERGGVRRGVGLGERAEEWLKMLA
ncbi:NAD(P)-binding protein [Pyrenochaeta sp. DS3sAY3a]|nr:NAD(P)-binding protein [Pyrenochaeta sp. DS3sAY3a]